MYKRRTLILILSLVLLCSVLVSCSSDRYTCYYGFFEDSAYASFWIRRTIPSIR